jgi:hypothetical protein
MSLILFILWSGVRRSSGHGLVDIPELPCGDVATTTKLHAADTRSAATATTRAQPESETASEL